MAYPDELSRLVLGQRVQHHLWQVRVEERTFVAVADRDEHHDRVRREPPCDERERVRARSVQPVGVFDDQRQRPPGCGVGEQLQRGQRDEKQLGAVPSAAPNAVAIAARWVCGRSST